MEATVDYFYETGDITHMRDGFSLHAGVHIHASDHKAERNTFRSILRPPLAPHRLSMGEIEVVSPIRWIRATSQPSAEKWTGV